MTNIFNANLGELLTDSDPIIKRHATGILKRVQKLLPYRCTCGNLMKARELCPKCDDK